MARHVQAADGAGLALLTLVDTPGFEPGRDLEWRGMIRHGAEAVHAYCAATVPRMCVVLRKAYGGAYIVMDSRSTGSDLVLAWPGAEVAVMGAVAAVRILHRRRLAEVSPEIRPQVEAELAAEHERIAGGVDKAVEIGVVDEVVDPARTRSAIAEAIDAAVQAGGVRRGHHGNIPL